MKSKRKTHRTTCASLGRCLALAGVALSAAGCSGPPGSESTAQSSQDILHVCEYCRSPAVPTQMASGQSYPRGLVVDEANLYWANEGDGTIMKMPTAGGTPVVIASGQNSPFNLALQYNSLDPYIVGALSPADDICWVTLGGEDQSDGTVVVSSEGVAHTLVSGQNQGFGVAADWVNVYWTDYANGNGGGAVMQAPLRGGPAITLSSGGAPEGIAVDAAYVYWVDEGGTVMKVPIGGGAPITLAAGQNTPAWIATDARVIPGALAQNVYWTTSAGGTVMKVPAGGGAAVTLASGQNGPWTLVLDSQNVYWANSDAIMMVPVGGGTVTTLVSGLGGTGPSAIAVDSTRVYWTGWDVGTVMSIPR